MSEELNDTNKIIHQRLFFLWWHHNIIMFKRVYHSADLEDPKLKEIE